MTTCGLCEAVHENFRLIKETKHSFCVIAKEAIKEGHVMILPKRHVTQDKFSDLSPDEAQDLLALMNEMQLVINEFADNNAIIFKNSIKHQTQEHLHFHVLPSKYGLRRITHKLEQTPFREAKTKEEERAVRDRIIRVMNQ